MGAPERLPQADVNSSILGHGPSLAELDERARDSFRRIVES